MHFSKQLENQDYQAQRDFMVRSQIEARGVRDNLVLNAMRKVPRHLFVPVDVRKNAYDDNPLYIGFGQTISQPYIVAFMTELLNPRPNFRVLEVGTGSGYQTAILAEIVNEIYSIEIVPELKECADSIFKELGYANIVTRCSDGYFGWPDQALFDGILVTAAPEKAPEPLLQQLKNGGRLVLPVGDLFQNIEIYTRVGEQVKKERNISVRFVPMTGRAENE
jgi:protein-L-isoaspartate(D-aspartate) O-methyltransferase